jgi:hypothetical protein
MSTVAWTLVYRGAEKSFADWGIKDALMTRRNMAADVFAFKCGDEYFDAPAKFAYDDEVRIYKDRSLSIGGYSGGTQYFVGMVKTPSASATASSEGRTYLIHGPWQWLEELEFHQPWAIQGANVPTTHLMLNFQCTVVQQLHNTFGGTGTGILDWVIRKGAPIQVGAIDIPANQRVPFHEARDQMCAEVFRWEMKAFPDVVVWFDYRTATPTMHISRYSSMPAVTVNLSEKRVNAIKLTPRHDLVLPVVVINYETAITTDGETDMRCFQEVYPTTADPTQRRAMVCTLDLVGPTTTHLEQELVAVGGLGYANHTNAAARLSWWKMFCPEMERTTPGTPARPYYENQEIHVDASLGNVFQVDQEPDDEVAYTVNDLPNILVEGSGQGWLEDMESPIICRKGKVNCIYTTDIRDASGELHKKAFIKVISIPVTFTNAPCNTDGSERVSLYTDIKERISGEAPADFFGLALNLYTSHAVLHYDGQITLSEAECNGAVFVGKKLNIAGGSGMYSAINAMVQGTTERIEDGATTVILGVPRHLGAGDIVEWIRAFRGRKRWVNPSTQATGKFGKASAVKMPRQGASTKAQSDGAHSSSYHAVSGAADGTNKYSVKLDATAGKIKLSVVDASSNDVSGRGTFEIAIADLLGNELKAREIPVCFKNSAGEFTKGYITGIFSPFYTTPKAG